MAIKREKIVPHLKEGKKINLYISEGNVYNIRDFVNKFKSKLNVEEKKIIESKKNSLSNTIPQCLKKPLTRSFLLAISKKKIIVNRSGARSAYWIDKKLKFKGCRVEQDLKFPTEHLEFGVTEMTSEEINFGVLSSENVMREILAYCFFKKFKMQSINEPVCVFEYTHENIIIGYCLVSKMMKDIRIEKDVDYHGLTMKDLIKIKYFDNKFKLGILMGEAGFKGIDQNWYYKRKCKILLDMNFNGGFRSILNSNIGNDLIYKNQLYVTDFDTFKVIKIPKKSSYKFIKNFVLWCVVEFLKNSPTILDYINLEDKDEKQARDLLTKSFVKNSKLWRCYHDGFLVEAKKRGWNIKNIHKAVEYAKTTKVYHDMILDVVPNSKLLKESYSPELSLYIPHG